MELQEARTKLIELQDNMSAYSHALSLMNFDGETRAPIGTTSNRAHASGILGREFYKIATGEETIALLEFLNENKEELPANEARMVTLMYKDINEMKKIPIDEYVEYDTLLVESVTVWKKAKAENDFASFAPYLEKIIETEKRFAAYVAPEKAPYDYLLDKYEDGLDMATCDAFFEKLKAGLIPLIQRIKERPQVDSSILEGDYPDYIQEKLALYLMELIGLDLDHVLLATTEHPFTTKIGSHFDERITTKYDRRSFSPSMYSVIHEGGHALYDTGSADDLVYTVLDGGVSMGIHESQSRFYENYIGRSLPFIRHIFPKVKELFGESLKDATPEDLYRAVNKSTPSLIRTEADEVTYCLHILIRYELEKAVVAGEISVGDLPGEWNKKYKEYLGVDVPNDSKGVLQDTHWGSGLIGYFPSYALGTAYSAQFFSKMKETVDVEKCLDEGNFGPINDWNREHIWKYGSSLTPKEVFANAAQAEFDPQFYIDYLVNKYSDIYGL